MTILFRPQGAFGWFSYTTSRDTIFQALLKDRNWLVHSSNADSKKALDDDVAYSDLHRRLESMLDETGRLLKEISALSEKFVLSHGVSVEALEARIAETLGEWQS
ncbi:hypothetical protein [Pseudomonas putida]|uniref:hypothetical protein n=1 Tax=Pseudomonas putida TaxID=303 RepID=UPI001E342DF0|nr:hypothetical protein [Pseudomonas putida]MCE0975443.1 hypothetical protein [Pseudomonas putida]